MTPYRTLAEAAPVRVVVPRLSGKQDVLRLSNRSAGVFK